MSGSHDDSGSADDPLGGVGAAGHHSARNPACDLCREKKIRCGREKPRCNNCKLFSASCTYSERQKRDNEASRNAQRFEEVNDRLDRMEAAMTKLVSTLDAVVHHSASSRGGVPSPAASTTSSSTGAMRIPLSNSVAETINPRPVPAGITVSDPKGDHQYLGPSSFASISNEAETLVSEKLKTAAKGGPERLSEAIGALKGLSHSSSGTLTSCLPNYVPFLSQKTPSVDGGPMPTLEVPPKEEVDELVEEFFTSVHHWFPLFDRGMFKAEVDRFYADPDSLSSDRAWLACFNNVCLMAQFHIFNEVPVEETKKREELRTKVAHFFYNGWAALDDLSVFLGPRLRNVQALVTGAVSAIEVSKPGLTWSLISQAARSCQAIGLHRSAKSSGLPHAEIEERKCVFWNIYCLEKALALSMGRSTCLPDFDCDVELPDPGTISNNFTALIQLAKIHSRIYFRLYSANASRLSEDERARAIKDLDGDLRGWWQEWNQVFREREGEANDAEPMVISFEHTELRFNFYSSMTLVHRMARPSMYLYEWSDAQCLENARSAMSTITTVVRKNQKIAVSGMLLWLFQFYPFSSFFVLFSAIIRNPSAPTSSSVDLPLMQDLVAYLQKMKSKNEGAAKLLSVAAAFTHVAKTFLKNYHKALKRSAQGPGGAAKRRKQIEGASVQDQPVGWLQLPSEPPSATTATTAAAAPPPLPATPGPGPPSLAGSEHRSPSETVSEESGASSGQAGPYQVDLGVASFLRWPELDDIGVGDMGLIDAGQGGGGNGNNGSSGGSGLGVGGSLGSMGGVMEQLLQEPIGFQMQMEQAQMRGPLEFDWIGWEGSM